MGFVDHAGRGAVLFLSSRKSEINPISCDRGAAAVEFSIALPVLLVLICGAVDWSLLLYARHVAIDASRQAARTFAVDSELADDLADGPLDAFEERLAWLMAEKVQRTGVLKNLRVAVNQLIDVDGNGRVAGSVTISGSYPTAFLRIIGIRDVWVSGKSPVLYEWSRVAPQELIKTGMSAEFSFQDPTEGSFGSEDKPSGGSCPKGTVCTETNSQSEGWMVYALGEEILTTGPTDGEVM